MTQTNVLDLRGIAGYLRVNYWRVRKWRRNAQAGTPQSRHLLEPDVLADPPRWSKQATARWAKTEGLWPPGSDQRRCAVCGGKFSVFENGAFEGRVRPHGWTPDEDGHSWPCNGSYEVPAAHKGGL